MNNDMILSCSCEVFMQCVMGLQCRVKAIQSFSILDDDYEMLIQKVATHSHTDTRTHRTVCVSVCVCRCWTQKENYVKFPIEKTYLKNE